VHPTPGRSSARPAPTGTTTTEQQKLIATPARQGAPVVVVLDTGLPITGTAVFPPAMVGAPISPFDASFDVDGPDLDPSDRFLDEVAGHGTFIAGLVSQVAPGCNVTVHKVLASAGDTDEEIIFQRLESLRFDDPTHTVLSLSFGGYVPELPQFMAAAIAKIQKLGVVVVASAGNDGTCEPMFPAALPGVVSVGAIGPGGPAFFTNYGPWVRACAPGVDLLSTFFMFDGSDRPTGGAQDPDNFKGWAIWSGTSFSGPVVAGALARTMMAEGCTAEEAVARVVDNPFLLRLPGLGTVVNVI
jgi:subtilisin family serine protease